MIPRYLKCAIVRLKHEDYSIVLIYLYEFELAFCNQQQNGPISVPLAWNSACPCQESDDTAFVAQRRIVLAAKPQGHSTDGQEERRSYARER